MLDGLKSKKENSSEISIKFTSLLAISAGLYPLIYLYINNFSLVSSWYQFLSLAVLFIALPLLVFIFIRIILTKLKFFNRHIVFILTFLNLCLFIALSIYATNGLNKKLLFVILIITFIISFWVFKHVYKLVKFKTLM